MIKHLLCQIVKFVNISNNNKRKRSLCFIYLNPECSIKIMDMGIPEILYAPLPTNMLKLVNNKNGNIFYFFIMVHC